MSGLPYCYSGFPSLSDSSLYYASSLLQCPVHLDAVHQSMCLLLSGLMAAATTILLELDPFFMLPDLGPIDPPLFAQIELALSPNFFRFTIGLRHVYPSR